MNLIRTAAAHVVLALFGLGAHALPGATPVAGQEPAAPSVPHAVSQGPRDVVFAEDLETGNLARWDDRDGNLPPQTRLAQDPAHVHGGRWAVELTAAPGRGTGGDLIKWFGANGYDRLYARWYIQFAADYGQGYLHHAGGTVEGLKINCLWFLLYIHDNAQDNKVWFDDIVIATKLHRPPGRHAVPRAPDGHTVADHAGDGLAHHGGHRVSNRLANTAGASHGDGHAEGAPEHRVG